MRHFLAFLLALGGVLLTSEHASAQDYGDPEPELRIRGYRDHTGFFSHFSLGLGYGGSEGDSLGQTLEQKGVAYAYHFALGGCVIPGLAVHFSAFGFQSWSSSLEIDGREDKDISASSSATGLGAGLTYYPSTRLNMYGSASGGLGLVSVTNRVGNSVGVDPGFGLRGAVGYEWWVGYNWGIGVALEGSYFQANDETSVSTDTFRAFSVAPVVSLTSN